MTEKTFVLDGTEVRMTGRTAVKTMKSMTPGKEGRVFTLYEVTPVDTFAGEWKKWCRMEDVFEVVTPNK